jgi:tetratricopeptide (TPR) repeat protein
MMCRRVLGLVVGVALWSCLATDAAAQSGDAEIDKGIALYNDLEYEQAATVLAKAVANRALDTRQKTEGYKTLALSYVAMGKDDDARAAFRALLQADPRFELPRTENPKALDLFSDVKSSMAVAAPAAAVRVTQASPMNPTRGGAITVSVVVTDEAKAHASVVLHHRVRGQRSFSSIKASRAPSGRYSAVIPGAFVDAPGVEYYVVAVDAKGEAVASTGSDDEPLLLDVREEGETSGAAFYTKWWFWGGVAGTVVAGAALGFVLLSGDEGGSDPATVNVTVNYMPP